MASVLTQEEIDKRLADISVNWAQTGDALEREFKFDDYVGALDFVNKISQLAEKQKHHPDIALSWGKVVVSITSHDAGGITKKDFTLAHAIDSL